VSVTLFVCISCNSKKASAWHGVLFVRQKLYKNGIFKFVLEIPLNYPGVCPSVKFISKVFHPQVDESDGTLNLKLEFPTWNDHLHLYHVLIYLKKIFYCVSTVDPLNRLAADLYCSNMDLFQDKVSLCVKESISNIYINAENNSLKFTPWKPEHDSIRKAILLQTSLKASTGEPSDMNCSSKS